VISPRKEGVVLEKRLMEVVDQTLKAFRKNKIDALFVASREEALRSVLTLIPDNAVVGAGASITLKEIGVLEGLKGRNHVVLAF
jgi:L-lactate utilization protein LutB